MSVASDNDVLNERGVLSRDGVVAISLPLDSDTHELVGDPEISSLGFVQQKSAEDLMERAREVVESAVVKALASDKGASVIESLVREEVNRFFYQENAQATTFSNPDDLAVEG